ncbi:uncharacterized protein LOC131035237 isoform X2 [Cryptomeria japonica]|nr:uncharacterized protein LOC131035237 isoform X2 [Cryptomeria japonica]
MRVMDKLRNDHPQLKVQGFYTREIRHNSERTGFEVVTVDGHTSLLASSTPMSGESARWPNVGKYKVDVSGFESLALPELQINEGTGLYIIDEVGKMELFSSSFFPAVLRVLNSNIPVLASIPIPKFGRDIPEVASIRNRMDAALYTLDKSNRDRITEQISALISSLRCK